MIPVLVISAIVAAVIGTVFGRAAATMTKPMSDSFRIFGPIWSAGAGAVISIIALLFVPDLWMILYGTIVGAVVGCAAVEFQVWKKNH